MIMTDNGERPIETIREGDYVMTRKGAQPVTAAGMTNAAAEVVTLELSNGIKLIATSDHPVYVPSRGMTPIDMLRYGDILMPWRQEIRESPSALSSTGSSFEDIRTAHPWLTEAIFRQMQLIAIMASVFSIKKSGKPLTEKSLPGARSIIRILTHLTTPLTIWNALRLRLTKKSIEMTSIGLAPKKDADISIKSDLLRLHGIHQRKVALGIGRTIARMQPSKRAEDSRVIANNVADVLLRDQRSSSSARTIANPNGAELQESITKSVTAHVAEKYSPSIITANKFTAPVHVVAVFTTREIRPVYNLTVETDHEYFANGILVSNCDMCRYMAMDRKRAVISKATAALWQWLIF
jgi:hypothetical protein